MAIEGMKETSERKMVDARNLGKKRKLFDRFKVEYIDIGAIKSRFFKLQLHRGHNSHTHQNQKWTLPYFFISWKFLKSW